MEQMKPEDTDNMTKKSVQVPDSNPDTKVSSPARNGDDNGDWTNFVMGSESQAQGQTTDQSLNSIASGSTKSVHWNPDLVSESTFNHEASSPNGSNAYGGRSPALTSSTSFKDTVQDVRNVLGRWGKSVGEATKKAEDFAGNTWQHLKTSPSFTEAAMGRIAQGAKILAEGGYERVFRQTFETVPEEQLQNSFACYLSTSAGPVMGLLYVSTTKLAYCSDGPLSYKDGDKTEWSYYKGMNS